MYKMRSLSREYWPGKEIANDLFGHFLSRKFTRNPLLQASACFLSLTGCLFHQTHIYTRESFRHHLIEVEPFANFWTLVQEMYPEKEDYFTSLLDPTKPYEPEWLVKRIHKLRNSTK